MECIHHIYSAQGSGIIVEEQVERVEEPEAGVRKQNNNKTKPARITKPQKFLGIAGQLHI